MNHINYSKTVVSNGSVASTTIATGSKIIVVKTEEYEERAQELLEDEEYSSNSGPYSPVFPLKNPGADIRGVLKRKGSQEEPRDDERDQDNSYIFTLNNTPTTTPVSNNNDTNTINNEKKEDTKDTGNINSNASYTLGSPYNSPSKKSVKFLQNNNNNNRSDSIDGVSSNADLSHSSSSETGSNFTPDATTSLNTRLNQGLPAIPDDQFTKEDLLKVFASLSFSSLPLSFSFYHHPRDSSLT